jgi:fatty acid amide hydrolase 2
LLQILAGPDGVDTACRPMDLGDPDTVDISKLNVLVVDGNGKIGVSKDMIEALHKSAGALDQMGAKVQTAKFDGLKDSLDIWSAMLSKGDGLSFSQMLGQGTEISETGELVKWALRKSPHTLPAIILAMVEKMPKKFVERTERFIEKGRQLRKEMTERMGENGILLYPSYSRPAPKHNVPMALAFHWVYTGIFNVMLFPVTQVPLGLNAAGLPLGVQVAAMHGNDHITIAVAKALEEKFGGWVPPVNL